MSDERELSKGKQERRTSPFLRHHRRIHAYAWRLTDRSAEWDAGRPQHLLYISARIPNQGMRTQGKASVPIAESRNDPALDRAVFLQPSTESWMTNLNLGDESAIRGDAISAILNVMQGIFPRDLEVLHDEHDHERRRGRNTTWNRGRGSVCKLLRDDRNKIMAVRVSENQNAVFI